MALSLCRHVHVLSLNQGPEEYDWTTFRSGEGVGVKGSCYPKEDMDGGPKKAAVGFHEGVEGG